MAESAQLKMESFELLLFDDAEDEDDDDDDDVGNPSETVAVDRLDDIDDWSDE